MTKCKVCGQTAKYIFSSKILCKHEVNYFNCESCGFLQTQAPFWLEEAYQESINKSDTGIMERNLFFSKIVFLIIYFFFDNHKSFVDFAGGYGILTRLMRDIGLDFYWHDKFSENLLARGFEYNKQKVSHVELLTSIESFEHFERPLEEIEKMLAISKNIFFSTELLPEGSLPNPEDWWYYGLEHGQHISFFSLKTLKFIAQKYKLNLYSTGKNIHLLTEKKINKLFFFMVLKLYRTGMFNFLKKRFNSKVMSDRSYIVNELKE